MFMIMMRMTTIIMSTEPLFMTTMNLGEAGTSGSVGPACLWNRALRRSELEEPRSRQPCLGHVMLFIMSYCNVLSCTRWYCMILVTAYGTRPLLHCTQRGCNELAYGLLPCGPMYTDEDVML